MKSLYLLLLAGATIAAAVAGTYAQTSAESKGDEVRVTVFANAGHAAPIVGTERGFFSDEIGNVTVNLRIVDSGPQAVESLFSGSSDIAYVGPGPAVNGFLRSNGGIVVLGGAASGGASFVAGADSGIASIADLDGKRVAAPQIANTQDVSLRHHLEINGLVPAERGGTVHVINVPNPDIYTLFAKGDIDAAWVPEPWATLLVRDLGGTRVFEEKELWENEEFASVLLVANAEYAQENPEIVAGWLAGHENAVKWVNSNPDEAAEILYEFSSRELGASFDRQIISESLARTEITSDVIPESVREFASMAHSLGYLGRGQYSLEGLYYGGSVSG